MASEKRKTAGRAAALILFAAAFGAAGWYLYQLRTELEASEAHITELTEENEQIFARIIRTEDLTAVQKDEMETYKDMDARAAEEKELYYQTCKELEDAVLAGTADCRIAYLTFDDGPYEETTPGFLDVLKEYDVLATVFELGKPWYTADPIYHRVYEEGHTIGNHTYSHQIRNGIYQSTEAFMNDLLRNREFIQEKLGYTTTVMRFPGGSSTAGNLRPQIYEELRKEGYAWVDWDCTTGDGTQRLSPEKYRDNVLNNTWGRELLVVLMHDYNANTLRALPEIIEGLRDQGYVLLPLFHDSAAVNK